MISASSSKSNDCSVLNLKPISFSIISNLLDVWHAYLGHANSTIVNHVLKLCNVSIFYDKNYVCASCQFAKSHLLPFSLLCFHAIQPLELIHADLWGPAPMLSTYGSCYVVLFIDDYSRFSWLSSTNYRQALNAF